MDCILCGKCKKSCPAYTIYREELFSPRGKMLMYDQKVNENDVDFKCLFCGNCITNCPFDIDVPITFIFGGIQKFDDEKPREQNILIDTTGRDSARLNLLSTRSSKEFEKILSVTDGVEALFKHNSYNEIREFKNLLESNLEYNLYFTERSSYSVAQRIGFKNCFLLSEGVDIEIASLPKNLTMYYKYLSESEFALLELDMSKYTEPTYVDVDFNFGNENILFYLDTI